MQDTCLIISGGDFSPLPEELRRSAYVIACDRGWQYARRLGLTPDLVVGDFDSAPPPDTALTAPDAFSVFGGWITVAGNFSGSCGSVRMLLFSIVDGGLTPGVFTTADETFFAPLLTLSLSVIAI